MISLEIGLRRNTHDNRGPMYSRHVTAGKAGGRTIKLSETSRPFHMHLRACDSTFVYVRHLYLVEGLYLGMIACKPATPTSHVFLLFDPV